MQHVLMISESHILIRANIKNYLKKVSNFFSNVITGQQAVADLVYI